MSFEPKSDNHAIVEVVFGLTFERDFAANEIEALAQAHDQWKGELPRLSRSSLVQVVVGPSAVPDSMPAPVGGVMFDRVKPDGNLEWRLRVEERSIYVNCLAYKRWKEIWPSARSFLQRASQIVAGRNRVAGSLLQYIDVFEWRGSAEKYDLRALLNNSSPLIPDAILSLGHLWHLHTGWFRTNDLPVEGRLLERLNFDGVLDREGIPTVKLDTYMQMQQKEAVALGGYFSDNGAVDEIFETLHHQNKALVRSLITEEMAKRIGLDA